MHIWIWIYSKFHEFTEELNKCHSELGAHHKVHKNIHAWVHSFQNKRHRPKHKEDVLQCTGNVEFWVTRHKQKVNGRGNVTNDEDSGNQCYHLDNFLVFHRGRFLFVCCASSGGFPPFCFLFEFNHKHDGAGGHRKQKDARQADAMYEECYRFHCIPVVCEVQPKYGSVSRLVELPSQFINKIEWWKHNDHGDKDDDVDDLCPERRDDVFDLEGLCYTETSLHRDEHSDETGDSVSRIEQ